MSIIENIDNLFSVYDNGYDELKTERFNTLKRLKLIKQLKIDQKELIHPLDKQFADIIQNQKMMIMTIDTIRSDLLFFK